MKKSATSLATGVLALLLLLGLTIGGCGNDGGGSGGGDGDAGSDTDTDADGDSDADSDADSDTDTGGPFVDIPLNVVINHVQPMTGIVLWNDHGSSDTTAIQLEYSYMPFDDVAVEEDPGARVPTAHLTGV